MLLLQLAVGLRHKAFVIDDGALVGAFADQTAFIVGGHFEIHDLAVCGEIDDLRLGAYPCVVRKGTLAARLYAPAYGEKGKEDFTISERHRHRYELKYDSEGRKALEAAGLKVSGTSPDGTLVEIVELPGHPYFIACQFHPEFKSRPTAPHPLFDGLVAAALKQKKGAK